MGLFSKIVTSLGANASAVVKHGAKQVQKGKSGIFVNAFAKAGQNAKKFSGNKR